MLKTSASGVLASFRPSTYRKGTPSALHLAAALLDEHFEHPAGMSFIILHVWLLNF
jgi:hypothetical protein